MDAKPKRKSKKKNKPRTEKVQTTIKDTVSVSEIKIVKKEEVRYGNEVITMDETQEERQEISSEGSLAAARHSVVEVLLKEPKYDENDDENEIFVAVEQQAQFQGNVNKWLTEHIVYPKAAADNMISKVA